MNVSSSARTASSTFGHGWWRIPRRPQPSPLIVGGASERPGSATLSTSAEATAARSQWAGLAVSLAALVVAGGLLFVSLSPQQGARPKPAAASLQSAKVSGHFRNADVKAIFGAIAAQVQAQLVVDPDLTRKIDTFDVEGERLQDVMNDLCTISACDWRLEAGSPPTLTIRQRGKAAG